MTITEPFRLLFVCLGNICRSPTAEAVFSQRLAHSPLAGRVQIDSAGTGDWHIGKPPDPRTQAAALRRGYRMDHLRARQVVPGDFHAFDWIVAMDRENLANLRRVTPHDAKAALHLLLPFAPQLRLDEVPDPYYGGESGFETVLSLVEAASDGLLQALGRHL